MDGCVEGDAAQAGGSVGGSMSATNRGVVSQFEFYFPVPPLPYRSSMGTLEVEVRYENKTPYRHEPTCSFYCRHCFR